MYQPLAISGKPYALVEQKPADKFEKYKKQLKPVVEWKKHQADFQGRGMEIKQSLSFTAERRRNCDLQKQKTYSGPLMTPEDADTSEAVKLDRLYLEVRYARYSILYYHCLRPVHYSASKRSTVQEVTTTDIQKNLSVSKEGLLCSINHLGTL